MIRDDFLIEELTPADEACVVELIRRNLQGYEEAGSVLASTWRRLENLAREYSKEGARYFVAHDPQLGTCIGGAGLGSLHGLPPSEGMGEIRDLVVDKDFRGRGIGTRLLRRCLQMAREFGYQRLYLETTPQMENAQKLFVRFGFRPVTLAQSDLRDGKKSSEETLPCYYLLEDLSQVPSHD